MAMIGAAVVGAVALVVLGVLLIDPFGDGGGTSVGDAPSPITGGNGGAMTPTPDVEPTLDKGQPTLEKYFTELQMARDEWIARLQPLEEKFDKEFDSWEESVAARRAYHSASVPIWKDLAATVDAIEPPATVGGAHDQLVAAATESAELYDEYAEELADMDEAEGEPDAPNIAAAFDRFFDRWCTLQDTASANDIDADFDC